MSVTLLSLFCSVKCLHCMYIRLCPCTGKWCSLEHKQSFPLCWGVPFWTASSKGLLNLLFFNRSCWHPCNQNSAYRILLRILRRQKQGITIVEDLDAGDKMSWLECCRSLELFPSTPNFYCNWFLSACSGSKQLWMETKLFLCYLCLTAGHQAQCMCRGQKQ